MKKCVTLFITAIFVISIPAAAFGHGVDIDYRPEKSYQITARYDTDEPVSEGQVVIYAPDKPAEPWASGKCDEKGRYTFTPDPSKQGTWDIQVRKAGHGGMIHIPVGEGEAVAPGNTGFTTLQVVVMAACAIWGLIGTALFFARGKN